MARDLTPPFVYVLNQISLFCATRACHLSSSVIILVLRDSTCWFVGARATLLAPEEWILLQNALAVRLMGSINYYSAEARANNTWAQRATTTVFYAGGPRISFAVVVRRAERSGGCLFVTYTNGILLAAAYISCRVCSSHWKIAPFC